MRVVLKEIGIYLFLLLFLSIWMHAKAWLHHPIEHLKALPSSPLGWWHPFVLTFVVYILILIVRVAIALVRRYKARI